MTSLVISGTFISLFYLLPLVATGVVAHNKHRRWILWLLLALFFPILTLITVAILAPMVPCKRCPECRRFSRATTLTCPYCNLPMPEGPIEDAADPASGNKAVIAVVVAAVVGIMGIAVIGILAAIAIPQFANLVTKSQEAGTKANLGSLRSALAIYYGDTNGRYPKKLEELTVGGKYLQQIPQAILPRSTNSRGHPSTSQVTYGALNGGMGLTDTGGWFFDNTNGPTAGQILVNCTHTDLKGKRWDTY